MSELEDYLAINQESSIDEICKYVHKMHLEFRQKLGRWLPYSLKPMKCRLLGAFYADSQLYGSSELPEIEATQIAFPKIVKNCVGIDALEFGICASGDVATSGAFRIKAGVVVGKAVHPDFVFVPVLLCDSGGVFLEREGRLYHELIIEERKRSSKTVFCGVLHSQFLVSKIGGVVLEKAGPSLDYIVTDKKFLDISGAYTI